MTGPVAAAIDETVTACPECGSARIRRRNPEHPSSPETQTNDWACLDCPAHFDEPDERPMQTPGGRHGLAKRLVEADPDAVGGD